MPKNEVVEIQTSEFQVMSNDYFKFTQAKGSLDQTISDISQNYTLLARIFFEISNNAFVAYKFSDVFKFAEETYGFKKTFVHNLIAAGRAYDAGKITSDYTFSQVSELLPVIDFPEVVEDAKGKSIKEIREIKKAVKADFDFYKAVREKVTEAISAVLNAFPSLFFATQIKNGTDCSYEITASSIYKDQSFFKTYVTKIYAEKMIFSRTDCWYSNEFTPANFIKAIRDDFSNFKDSVDNKEEVEKQKASKPKAKIEKSPHGLTNQEKRLAFAKDLANWEKVEVGDPELFIYRFKPFPVFKSVSAKDGLCRIFKIVNNTSYISFSSVSFDDIAAFLAKENY